ncbi:MAG TPA: hypothetical protein VF128_13100, partial [Gemmatimonadaceae bacterium]
MPSSQNRPLGRWRGSGGDASLNVVGEYWLPFLSSARYTMMVAMTPLSQVYWYHQRARPRRDLPPL